VRTICQGFDAAVLVPAVPVQMLSPLVRSQLAHAARSFVEQTDGRMRMVDEPEAAARACVALGEANTTAALTSTWTWRCAYAITVGGHQGLIVVETQRMQFDVDEQVGDQLGADRGSDARAWLLVPCALETAATVVQKPGGVCLGSVPVHPPDPSTIVIRRS